MAGMNYGGINIMEAKMCSYEDFPASELAPEGMKVMEADRSLELPIVKLNVKYSEKEGYPLHLQMIYPPVKFDEPTGREKKFPLIVYIQGSAWMAQELGQSLPGLCRFAKRGYTVAVVEYRPSPVASFPAQIKDAKTAVRFLQKNADEYHVDKDKIFVWGDSSGGHTCTMIAATMEHEYNDEDGELDIKAFVDYFGPTDITKMNDQPSTQDHRLPDSPEGMLIGKRPVDSSPEWTDKVSPMNHISEGREMKPLLIIHGNKDRLVPFQQSVLLYEKMKEAHKKVAFYKLEGADHGGDAFWKEPVLDIVEQFLKENA